MLKREDLKELEALVARHGDAAEIPKRLDAETIEELGGAAPALALACLEADNYADMIERGEQVRMAETVRLRKMIREALAAACVEVEP